MIELAPATFDWLAAGLKNCFVRSYVNDDKFLRKTLARKSDCDFRIARPITELIHADEDLM